MELARGEIWWAELPEPTGLDPGYRRPVLIVQNDAFNRSRLHTTIAVVLTGNLRLVDAPGNVLLPARATGLPRDSVVNVTQLITPDRSMRPSAPGNYPPGSWRRSLTASAWCSSSSRPTGKRPTVPLQLRAISPHGSEFYGPQCAAEQLPYAEAAPQAPVRCNGGLGRFHRFDVMTL